MTDRQASEAADEIEVTQEMAQVGGEIINRHARDIAEGWVSPDEIAEQVFRAIMAVAPYRITVRESISTDR